MVPSINAASPTNVSLDTLVRMNIFLSKCRGQCYDESSNMSRAKNGMAANIREEGYFSIMVDETKDQSNREQVVIVLRHVDSER